MKKIVDPETPVIVDVMVPDEDDELSVEQALNLFETDPQEGYRKAAKVLRRAISDLRSAVAGVYDAGYAGIEHVSAANYPEREYEAILNLSKMRDKYAHLLGGKR